MPLPILTFSQIVCYISQFSFFFFFRNSDTIASFYLVIVAL